MGGRSFYDKVVNLQKTPDVYGAAQIISDSRPGLGSVSLTTVGETGLAIVAFPLLLLKRSRRDPALSAGLAWTAITTISGFVLTSLIEAAENNRFRFELGCLPLVAATLSLCWLLQRTRIGIHLLEPEPEESAITA